MGKRLGGSGGALVVVSLGVEDVVLDVAVLTPGWPDEHPARTIAATAQTAIKELN